MDKRKIVKDALTLFVITVISGLILGGVHEFTKGVVKRSEESAQLEAYRLVFPEAADFLEEDTLLKAIAVSNEELPKADYGNAGVEQALCAVDGDNQVSGYVITAFSNDSYNGLVKVLVGIDTENRLKGIEVIEINDTPGLGQLAREPEFKDQFTGKKAKKLTLSAPGGDEEEQIQAISGATITSSAVTNAVNAALYLVSNHVQPQEVKQ
ncbi:RnfABCDGE type electron transport complex subunit G [Clostridium sp. HBUAS56010]|uniref:RnfABCDGE type electron transport complex subunit G n=1 Tax=Clostridium sp. HBUAS56010 TaxID=2571127 RepID=UPI001178BEA7|nr:RnfABCDGE type electron transport complex subunit G [Clostridium sp. HBUAS56010]